MNKVNDFKVGDCVVDILPRPVNIGIGQITARIKTTASDVYMIWWFAENGSQKYHYNNIQHAPDYVVPK